mgnify:CR=1 FL=1
MINFGSGSIYTKNPDGNWTTLGSISELEVETYTDDHINTIAITDIFNPSSNYFECIAKVSKEFILAVTGLRNSILECCPNKRVVHLAINGRTRRIRKKNFNRAIKILEGERLIGIDISKF